ncbi:hypothetical protein HMPREF3220_03376 [Citrobacter koseri]|nr:hypothetical protein HMPREF3220_03376 [Citrobacter koseri]
MCHYDSPSPQVFLIINVLKIVKNNRNRGFIIVFLRNFTAWAIFPRRVNKKVRLV